MAVRSARTRVFFVLLAMVLPAFCWAQSFTSTVSGTVTDPSGAVVPNAEITLTLVATETSAKVTTGSTGLYSFPNLRPGIYQLKASAPGFRDVVQKGVEVGIEQSLRVDVKLELGPSVQTIEVTAAASPLKYDTAEVEAGISPNTLKELPILVAGTVRSAAAFAILMPGVSTGGGDNPFDARINGGLQTGDEAVMDGASMQQGMMNQTGMISMYSDFPMTPDMVSELRVLTSSYAPEYGSTLSGQIVVESKSGGANFHGGVYEYLRNTALNARQFGAEKRPPDKEHDFGGFLGGPFKLPGGRNIPWFNTGKKKSYFYLNLEGFRRSGGVVAPVGSVPSMKNRHGDFSDWLNADTGALIPIYDPRTTRMIDPALGWVASNLTRDQFMGCDGNTPNVICTEGPNRYIDPVTGWDIANSMAPQWLQYVPEPNRGTPFGIPLDNYIVPKPRQEVTVTTSNYLMFRGDQYIGDKDHVSVTVWYQGAPPYLDTLLPVQIANESYTAPQFSFVDRARWDHTFTPTLLNHFGFGYLDRNEGYGDINWLKAPDALPRIKGTVSDVDPANNIPHVNVGDYGDYGGYGGYGPAGPNRTTRQTYIFMDTLTWVKGKHTIKFGGEYRSLGQNIRNRVGGGGYFGFSSGTTGLYGVTSGNSVASFLLEQVDNANVNYTTIAARYPRSNYYIFHVGDTWKATPKLSINYGVRWDTMTPATELYDHASFFDPLGANPGAGGRPGRLAFAGTHDLMTGESWGAAGFGQRHPENTWWGGFAPRLGIAYSVTPKTVIRAGYGIFYTQAFYPGWEGSIALDGFNANFGVSSTTGGLEPAMILSEGFPISQYTLPPFIDASYRNGQDLQYKPFDANRRAYAQQWNLSIEHQFGTNFTLSGAYVGNKGTRLPSQVAPLNALDPKLLTQYGAALLEEFPDEQTTIQGVSVPYAGWIAQLGCAPSLAQALLPYPQYCSSLTGMNENAGNSTYHSFQAKAEKRFAQGTFLLASYTLSKTLGSADQTQSGAMYGPSWVMSPFERKREKALAVEDVPQTLSLSLVYELPFGRGKRFLNTSGALDKLVGGWSMSNLFRISSGTPLYFRSGTCNVPGEFRVACIPGIIPGAYPWAQGKGTFDPNRPLFNSAAFEPLSGFEAFGYYGQGPRISNLRGFGFHGHNIGLIKDTKITERVNFQIRAEFFNIWNWHAFTCSNQCFGGLPFDTDISSPLFGMWNGGVSNPRNIQLAGRFEF
jgi:hypothetical protein